MTGMDCREWLKEARGLAYRRDGAGIVALLRRSPEFPPVWQLVGDAVAVALTQQVEGAAEVAAGCAEALRRRGWPGDAGLADELDGRPDTGLRPLAVDLEVLADTVEGDPVTAGGVLDVQTGEVWARPVIDGLENDAPDVEDEDRFLRLDGGSRAGYHDMVEFIDTVTDERLAEQLSRAVHGRGAFRRFAGTLGRASDAELGRWFMFTDERKRGRARALLAGHGYRVARP